MWLNLKGKRLGGFRGWVVTVLIGVQVGSLGLSWGQAITTPNQVILGDTVKKERVGKSIILPADTVLPGQKAPFKESQRLEGRTSRYLLRAILPASVLVGAGGATIRDRSFLSSFDVRKARNKWFPKFSTKVDDYLLFLPVVSLYGFNIFSTQNRHELRRQTTLLLLSGLTATALVFPTKRLTDINRPNGEPNAFPSGHTAYAFTIATMIDKEFRHKSPWISVGSFAVAGATGVLRVLNNEHWMADVLAGAGVGILSVNTVYWLHARYAKDKGLQDTALVPVVLPTGQMGLALIRTF